MEKMKNVPEIRFEGFEGEWNKKELDDEVDFYSGLTYSPKDVQKESGTFVIRSSNVKNNRLVEADDVYVNPDIVNSQNVEQGDIAVVVRNGSRHLIGKHAQITTKLDNTVIGAFMTGLRPKNNSDFVNALLNTQSFQKEIEKNLGATINQITTGPFKKMEFFFPEPNEQIVIGDFVKNLNDSIKNHNTQLKKLTNLKKAMLIKMFPQNGANVPEIRFKGFDGVWEEKQLYQVAPNISDGNWIESNHVFNDGEYRIIQTGNLGIGEYLDKENSAKYFYQKDFDEVRGNEIFPGDILISRLAEPAGRTIVLPDTKYRMVTSVDVTIIRPEITSFNTMFLVTQLNSPNILKIVNENVSGTSHRRISRTNLEKISLLVPEINEQEQIGEYFKNLNDLISNHKEQLKKLNQIKKACLSKLFVSQD